MSREELTKQLWDRVGSRLGDLPMNQLKNQTEMKVRISTDLGTWLWNRLVERIDNQLVEDLR